MAPGTACAGCGAALRPADPWCALCYHPVAGPPESPPTAPGRGSADPTALGERARVVVTAVVLLVPLAMLYYASLFGLAFAIIWWVFATPVILRDVWKRRR